MKRGSSIKILHIIPSLSSGGAEAMLFKLLKHGSISADDIKVVTFISGGIYKSQVEKLGIEVVNLSGGSFFKNFSSVLKTLKIVLESEIIHSWMYHADLFSFLIGKLVFRKKVIWGIRRSYIELDKMKRSTYFIASINKYFSKYVDLIISCSNTGKINHSKFGYYNEKIIVIPNGFEVSKINELNKSETFNFLQKTNNKIVLNVARWEPLKDHKTLLESFSYVKKSYENVNLILVGRGMDKENNKLMELIYQYGLNDSVLLFGEINDVPSIMSHADIYVSSSISEGFPNVIGEAMSSHLYCVATKAGDTEQILNKTGTLVGIQNPIMLSTAILDVLNMEEEKKCNLVKEGYQRVLEEFTIEKIIKTYEETYKKILMR